MLYLIGGASRVGKSQLTQKFITNKPMYSFSCDFLYGIDQIRLIKEFQHASIIEKGELYYPLMQRIVSNVVRQSENCVIEGEVILPRHIPELSKKYELKACFLGLSKTSLEEIIKFGKHFNWPKYKQDNGLTF